MVRQEVSQTLPAAVFGLEDRFADKYAILCIHVWLCLVRLRSENKAGKELAQVLYDNFQEDVEMRVRAAGVKASIFFSIDPTSTATTMSVLGH